MADGGSVLETCLETISIVGLDLMLQLRGKSHTSASNKSVFLPVNTAFVEHGWFCHPQLRIIAYEPGALAKRFSGVDSLLCYISDPLTIELLFISSLHPFISCSPLIWSKTAEPSAAETAASGDK